MRPDAGLKDDGMFGPVSFAWISAGAAAAMAAPPPQVIAPGVELIRGVGADEKARKQSLAYAEFYVGLLREHGGTSADCRR